MPRVPKASAASPLSHRPRKPPSTRHETAHPPGDPEVTRHLVVGQSEIARLDWRLAFVIAILYDR
jgi:hypothetical protein